MDALKLYVKLYLNACICKHKLLDVSSLEARGRNLSGHSHTETPSSMSSVSEMDELMNALELGDRVGVQYYHNHLKSKMQLDYYWALVRCI